MLQHGNYCGRQCWKIHMNQIWQLETELFCSNIFILDKERGNYNRGQSLEFFSLCIWYSPLPSLISLLCPFPMWTCLLLQMNVLRGSKYQDKRQTADIQIHRDTPPVLLHTSSSCFLGPSLILFPTDTLQLCHRTSHCQCSSVGDLSVSSSFQLDYFYLIHFFQIYLFFPPRTLHICL